MSGVWADSAGSGIETVRNPSVDSVSDPGYYFAKPNRVIALFKTEIVGQSYQPAGPRRS